MRARPSGSRSQLLLRSTTIGPRHGVVSRLDGGRCTGGAAILAVHAPEARGRVLVEVRVRRLAHLASDKLPDVLAEQTLHMLLLVSTLQGELAVGRRRTLCTELRQHEVDDVVDGPLHEVTNLGEIHPPDLLGAHTHDLRRLHDVLLRGAQKRILVLDDLIKPAQEIIVGISLPLLPLGRHERNLAILALRLLLLVLTFLLLLAEVELQLLLAVVGHGCRMRGLRWAGGGDSKPSIS
mmetsp:Transcript_178010/g.564986  ORF Transcript_178010/g.564986 Transcript_178010/m.564986 type:complete len:237 (-) Transcript_178010:20-730(-)